MTAATATATAAAAASGAPAALAPYRALFAARFRMLLQYRAAALGGLWTQACFGLILIMIYDAFYRSAEPAARPMAFGRVASYVWLAQALIAMLPWNIDVEMRGMLRSGGVAYELCRPVDLYAWWYTRALAQRTAPVVLRAVPMAVLAGFGLPLLGLGDWRLLPPPSLAAGLGFAAALAGGLALACAVSVLIYLCWLWISVAEGLVMVISSAVCLMSGLLVPLPLLPAWAQPALRWLPFAGLIDVPARVYSGELGAAALAAALARQLGWTVMLIALGRWLLGRGLRRVVVEGG